jgi:hypothetical protein
VVTSDIYTTEDADFLLRNDDSWRPTSGGDVASRPPPRPARHDRGTGRHGGRGVDGSPSTAVLGSRPHAWYDLTEGPVINLAELPGPLGVDAVMSRLLRLGRGEQVELLVTRRQPAS